MKWLKRLQTLWDTSKVVDILPNGSMRVGGILLNEAEILNLKGEVDLLKRTRLYGLLTETLRARAIYQGINKSENFDHVLVAKAMLVNLDLIESILSTIEKQ